MRQWLLFFLVVFGCSTYADSFTAGLAQLKGKVDRHFAVAIENWRTAPGDMPAAGSPTFDDSGWRIAGGHFSWANTGEYTWLRAKVVVPDTMAGAPIDGRRLQLELSVSNSCDLYINGRLENSFRGESLCTLTEHARPGDLFVIALRSTGQRIRGALRHARLQAGVLPEFGRYVDEATFVDLLAKRLPASQAVLREALAASEKQILFTDVTAENLEAARSQLARALARLAPLAAVTRKYDTYFIGHAHIDMNWQWSWPETIDICHRTWNSALNLLDQFPQFEFVQSQPAAYVPIEAQFPAEFARMQAMSASNRWDVVGGLWDESDTDIPSGEGLARSFMLGQEYFKEKFGRCALTGWLPDSFGHTWQLPQIMQLAGIKYFYHMRCGNGVEFAWWEAPDGSRVLKAQTQSYDAKPKIEQLVEPAENETRLGTQESLVVFGVGDHGGGPTREQIRRIQDFQADPIFPHIHFAGADEFFEQLAAQPATASFPVIDAGLQYIFEGCYTTHADIKASLRRAENQLYSAEVLASLDALAGAAYPGNAFREAWKPVAFAQFHDIACGTAIHSTYDWMNEQLAPTFDLITNQTERSLQDLNARVSTLGPGDRAVVVWNTLSFARDDVVKINLAGAAGYHSVIDQSGRRFPAQLMDGKTLVFVARGVPAFGHAVYFPQTNTVAADPVTVREQDEEEIDTPAFALHVRRDTGAITHFRLKAADWDIFGGAQDGNAFQLLGDSGTAWTIRYTGTNEILAGEGAEVRLMDDGPVFARVRVKHAFNKSSYLQDIIVYGALPRIDIPATIDWREEFELLKIRLPLNVDRPTACAQIPFGNESCPTTGQECPGQKWMDLSEASPIIMDAAAPIDLTPFFNSNCARNFDGEGDGYSEADLPAAGLHRLGARQIPFQMPGDRRGSPDHVAAAGQRIPIPSGSGRRVLYLLAARTKGIRGTEIGFELPGARRENRLVELNDWMDKKDRHAEPGVIFPSRATPSSPGKTDAIMWICALNLPAGASELILPEDPNAHFFAATVVNVPARSNLYGLSVLNDCKYGFDAQSNIFRLTALRSSARPDPHPDDGVQRFTYSLYPHAGDWQSAHTDEQALALNVPLLAELASPHPAQPLPRISVENIGAKGDLIVSALKAAEDGDGYILRFYEAQGEETRARIRFDKPMRAEEVDLLERSLPRQTETTEDGAVVVPVGHNQIVSLRFVNSRDRRRE